MAEMNVNLQDQTEREAEPVTFEDLINNAVVLIFLQMDSV